MSMASLPKGVLSWPVAYSRALLKGYNSPCDCAKSKHNCAEKLYTICKVVFGFNPEMMMQLGVSKEQVSEMYRQAVIERTQTYLRLARRQDRKAARTLKVVVQAHGILPEELEISEAEMLELIAIGQD